MVTRKSCKGSTIVELAYIMPLVLLIWMLVIYILFFFHDKSIVTGAAYEASVVGAELWMEEEADRSVKVEKYFRERIGSKLLFFENIDVKVVIEDEEVRLKAASSKFRMSLETEAVAAVTEPETVIRRMNILDEIVEGTTK